MKITSPPTRCQPSPKDMLVALQSMPVLKAKPARGASLLMLHVDGQAVPLPDGMLEVLTDCLQLMASGQSFTVLPVEKEIGTQEAADLLGVSRPFLTKQLDAGVILSRKVGSHRRVGVRDILAYQAKEKTARRKALTELAAEGQRLGLGE